MQQIIDPIIVFIASNAIFIAIGALFSNISNEIFSFEKSGNNEQVKYNNTSSDLLRKNIIRQAGRAYFIYILNLIFMILFFIYKYLFSNVSKLTNNYSDVFLVFFFVMNLSYLVIGTIEIFYLYFKIRNKIYEDKILKSTGEINQP